MTPLEQELRALGQSERPIIVGPWLSEVGFELLYWIPFLRWAIEAGKIRRENLWVLSRGGCRSWYADLTPNYLELYDWHAPGDLIRINLKRIAEQSAQGEAIGLRHGQVTAKQFCLSRIEQGLVAPIARAAGLEDYRLLHPSTMYRAFRPLWRNRKGDLFGAWLKTTAPKPLAGPNLPLSLPDRFVAVKFYASQANPDLPGRRHFVQSIVRTIADAMDVVLLHTGTAYDEHGEFPLEAHPRVHRIRYSPASNLDVQTAVIARSMAFVGTYGGFAYLAPFLGIPTTCLYGVRNFRRDHLRLMMQVSRQILATSFEIADIEAGLNIVKRQSRQWTAHAAA